MKLFKRTLMAAVAIATLAVPTQAHRGWMMPSSTVLSGDASWVTVDAAISNDLFYFEHQPMRGEPVVTAPDGSEIKVQNLATGRYRTTFDVELKVQGTYRIAYASDTVMGSYTLNGTETRLPRGLTADKLAAAIPAGATNVRTSQSSNRNETFVTLGAPTSTIFKPTGKGIELVPVTHPNDLVVGEDATFQFLLDGKPAAGLKVTVINGGIRYRDTLGQLDLKTDAQGNVVIKWGAPGMYWLNATVGGERGEGMGGPGAGPQAGAGAPPPPAPAGPPPRRANYVAVLEVMAP